MDKQRRLQQYNICPTPRFRIQEEIWLYVVKTQDLEFRKRFGYVDEDRSVVCV